MSGPKTLAASPGPPSGEGPLAQELLPPSDAEIIARVAAGEVSLFELLVERHKDQVGRIVAAKIPRQEAPEVVHEIFVRAFTSLSGYRPIKPFAHWLSTLAVRACHDFWRERYRRRETCWSDLSPEPGVWRDFGAETADGDADADPYRRYEAWELLDWALGHLSPGDRMALTLVYLEGWSLAEAAEALGWTQTVVKLRTFRARRKLRKIITDSMEVPHDPASR